MSTTTEMNVIQRAIYRHRLTADFLTLHQNELVAWDDSNVDHDDETATYISTYASGGSVCINCYGPNARLMMRRVRAMIGGKWSKSAFSDTFSLYQYGWGATDEVPMGISLSIHAPREAVCVKRVTGTETKVIPAVEAQPERTEEVEIVEWDCGDVLPPEAAA